MRYAGTTQVFFDCYGTLGTLLACNAAVETRVYGYGAVDVAAENYLTKGTHPEPGNFETL